MLLPDDFFVIALVLVIFSMVQSVFGVGLLVFGTPTFILLGKSFEETLSIILPASIMISALQSVKGYSSIKIRKQMWGACLPVMAFCLYLVLSGKVSLPLNYFVGVLLIFAGLVQTRPHLLKLLQNFLLKYRNIYIAIMGIVHGFSNMGGSLLTIFVTSAYKEKIVVRTNIAYGYCLMGLVQVAVLYFTSESIFTKTHIFYPIISGAVFLSFGNIFFQKTSENLFRKLITALMFLYGIITIASSFSTL